MSYDSKLDKKIALIGSVEAGKDKTIEVSIYSYDKGEARVSMLRTYLYGPSNIKGYAKIGRLSYDELTSILPLLEKAREWLEDHEDR